LSHCLSMVERPNTETPGKQNLDFPVHQEVLMSYRYKFPRFLCAPSASLQGIALRPLPCNYNVLQLVCAFSRR